MGVLESAKPKILPPNRPVRVGLAAAAFLIAVSLTLSALIARDEQAHLQSDFDRIVEGTASGVRAYVASRLDFAQILNGSLPSTAPDSRDTFANQTAPILRLIPEFQAINWADPSGVVRWVTPLEGNEAAVNLNVTGLPVPAATLAKARADGALHLTSPIVLAQGGRGVVGYQALGGDGDRNGFLNLVFRIEPLLTAALLDAVLKPFAVRINDGDALVHATADISETAAVLSQRDIRVADRTWTVSLFSVGDAVTSTVPLNYGILAAGLLVSLLVGYAAAIFVKNQQKTVESEQRFRDFARLNSDWFWETDALLRFSYLSERFEPVSGISADQLIGRTRREVGAPGAAPEALETLIRRTEAHAPFANFVHHRDHPVRGRVYLSISGMPVYRDGVFAGYRGTGRDITQEYLHAEELAKAAAAAERANEAKSEFLATMSHELRTPLNAILGFSEMLRRQYFGPLGAQNYEAYASDIYDSGEHLLSLINDILDISTIEAGKRIFEIENIDVQQVLGECVRVFDVIAAEKRITIAVALDGIDRPIRTDRKMIKQIFINLISNAVKYNVDGGRVDIKTRREGDRFVFTVADTGVGIPGALLPTVTEPFARSQTNPHLTHEGTGLGLAIVDALVNLAGGTVTIDSAENQGTTVTVDLPAAMNDMPEALSA